VGEITFGQGLEAGTNALDDDLFLLILVGFNRIEIGADSKVHIEKNGGIDRAEDVAQFPG